MRLIVNGYHVKNIPEKFEKIKEVENYIDDLDHKRLTKSERRSMTEALVMPTFLKSIKNPYVLEYISKAEPVAAAKIITPEKEYLVIIFSNKAEIRCDLKTYSNFHTKRIIKRLY